MSIRSGALPTEVALSEVLSSRRNFRPRKGGQGPVIVEIEDEEKVDKESQIFMRNPDVHDIDPPRKLSLTRRPLQERSTKSIERKVVRYRNVI
jgi:hypothetical protein